jgi:phosphotransferase system IIB component
MGGRNEEHVRKGGTKNVKVGEGMKLNRYVTTCVSRLRFEMHRNNKIST